MNFKNSLFFLALMLISLATAAQNAYNIKLTLKPYKNQYVYLGYYGGKKSATYIADSAMLNANSVAIFTGKKKLTGGIYFVVSPSRDKLLFELLLDKQQNFSIQADTLNLASGVVFTGSPDNIAFQQYTKLANENGKKGDSLNKQLSNAKTKADSTIVIEKMKTLNKEIITYRKNERAKNPNSILAAIFAMLIEPVVPEAENAAALKKGDSTFAYHFFKNHYWDGISFTDARLLRTPIFDPKLDRYYKDLVPNHPDSISAEIDNMLAKSTADTVVNQYLLAHFINKYIKPEYMGQDAVFVHLFEKYINGGATWMNEKDRKQITNRAYMLMANLIGKPAAPLNLVDSMGHPQPLYDIKAPYTVVLFWDATCHHCQETVPRVDSIFQAKWKKDGVKIYAVMGDGGKPAWVNYVKEHNLKDWIHVYETTEIKEAGYAAGLPNYKQLYDVVTFPVIYLLDKDKKIIAKNLTYLQVDDVMQMHSKGKL